MSLSSRLTAPTGLLTGLFLVLSQFGIAEAATPATWTPTGSLLEARSQHTASLLPDGQVLVAGGSGNVLLKSAELYDPSRRTWRATASMMTARAGHTVTLLTNNKVLVTGGPLIGPAELYDFTTATWTPTGSMTTDRTYHTATLLPSGKVLVAGGGDNCGGAVCSISTSAELYDPASGIWAVTGSMGVSRFLHTATLLPTGLVLVTGGQAENGGSPLSSAELYDPTSGTWTATGSMAMPRSWHTATLLPSGRVLVAGGNGDSTATELYDPATGTWSFTGSLSAPRWLFHTATLLPSGRVLLAGGLRCAGACVASTSAELYDPEDGTWTTTGSLGTARLQHSATLLANGRVLVAGGANDTGLLATAELYKPDKGCGRQGPAPCH